MQPIQEGEKEVKDLEDWAAVQKVYKQTKSKRATAKILNISRNTVKRLLDMTEPPVYRRTEYSSKIDEYKELIIEWRCDPYNYNGTRIFRELKERGYTGSIGPIYRFLGRLMKTSVVISVRKQPSGMKARQVIRHSSIGRNTRFWLEIVTGKCTASP